MPRKIPKNPLSQALAISPLDGRYWTEVEELGPVVGEMALFRNRANVEIEYFIVLAGLLGHNVDEHLVDLRNLYLNFSETDYDEVKKVEGDNKHDVRALEIVLRRRMLAMGISESVLEVFHLALTSEDTNSTAYALQFLNGYHILRPVLLRLIAKLESMAVEEADTVMLARTHGQPAIPTTFGKEMRVFVVRLSGALNALDSVPFTSKLNGATGTYAAHLLIRPDMDWEKFGQEFIANFGLNYTPVTTQIEPHDNLARFMYALAGLNSILVDLCSDMWQYIRGRLLKLEVIETEDGSSTMVNKVNPIHFENGRGNLWLANMLLEGLARYLPVSTMQRDLSDSTLTRNVGVALAYSLQAYKAILTGLGRVQTDKEFMEEEVEENPGFAEAIQIAMRAQGIPNAYVMLKLLTRGRKVTMEEFRKIIEGIPFQEPWLSYLRDLTPTTYVGIAPKLARRQD